MLRLYETALNGRNFQILILYGNLMVLYNYSVVL